MQFCWNVSLGLKLFYFVICVNWDGIMPTLLPGLGPRFLGILMGTSSLPGWMLCGPRTEPFWPQGPVTLVFLRPGLRPLWPGGLPTVGVGCIAGLSTLPSVSAPRLLGNTTAWVKMNRNTKVESLVKSFGMTTKKNKLKTIAPCFRQSQSQNFICALKNTSLYYTTLHIYYMRLCNVNKRSYLFIQ